MLVCLGPALLLTTVRLVEPRAGWALRVEAFTPLGIVLHAAALVVLLLGLLGRGRRVLVLVPAVLCVLGIGLHALWFSPMLLGANPPPAVGSEPMTVMTSNLLQGKGDGVTLVQQASDEDVDLLVVEEITPGVLADMEGAGLSELFPYRAGAPGASIDGTMVFSRQKLGKAVPLDTVMDSFAVEVGDLTLLAVHPLPPTDAAGWRREQGVIRVAASRYDPDLIVGDFNATRDHMPMRILAGKGFRDVAELADEGWQPTWPANGLYRVLGLPLPPLVTIDHVLIGSSLAALGSSTVRLDGTDHLAVVARVAAQ